MEIWHRVSFGHKDNIEDIFISNKIKFIKSPLPGGGFLGTIKIKESDYLWNLMDQLIKEKKLPDFYNTVFTNSEILQVEWVRLQPTFQQGYPQPENNWRDFTFTNQCPKCGIGYIQKIPFRINQEPKMGNNDFWSLYWAYSLFCTSKVLQILNSEEIKGYDTWPVIIHSTDKPSKVISQLLFSGIANPALADVDKLQPETCSECGVTKYLYHKRGYMHLKKEALMKNTDFQQTNEWFGSGGYSGFREILVSNRLAKLLIDNKWHGISLKPTLLV